MKVIKSKLAQVVFGNTDTAYLELFSAGDKKNEEEEEKRLKMTREIE